MFLKDINKFNVENATKANQLTTARTINGTSFNGTANITTANWGTARTLTIGNTGKSVNGSANVSWSLSEIGAANAKRSINAKADHASDWTNETAMSGKKYMGGWHGSTGSAGGYMSFGSSDGALDLFVDGQIYANANQRVYHTGYKPTPAEIGAAASSHGNHVPTFCDTISDWNAATRNGWFMGHNAANSPFSNKWYMGYVIAHNEKYVIQQVYDFTAGGVDVHNMHMHTRVKYNGTWGSWKQHFTVPGVPGSYWSKNVVVGGDGVVEVGKYMDWHFTNNSTADYDVRWQMTDAGTIESTGVLGAPAMKIGGNRVHVSSGTPSSPPVGTVWIQI